MSVVFQKFVDLEDKPLGALPAANYNDKNTVDRQLQGSLPYNRMNAEERYILWSEVEKAFPNISCLRNSVHERVFFQIDAKLQVIHPPRVAFSSAGYKVVLKHDPGDHQKRASTYEPSDPMYLIQSDLQEYKDICGLLTTFKKRERGSFLTVMASTKYYRDLLIHRIEGCADADSTPLQKLKKKALQDVDRLEAIAYEDDVFNRCNQFLPDTFSPLDFPVPRLFLVLPWDLKQWKKEDRSTHNFRLFFMCDYDFGRKTRDVHHYIHLANHQGYNIDRPQEFLQEYGEYALEILEMVKYGRPNDFYKVPKLQLFIAPPWRGSTSAIPYQLKEFNHLINEAIHYIQDLLPETKIPKLWPHRPDTRLIKTFLKLPQEHDNGTGALHQCRTTTESRWMCETAAKVYGDMKPLNLFIQPQEGILEARLGKLKLDLKSTSQGQELAKILQGLERKFEVTVNIAWKATRRELLQSVMALTGSGIFILSTDGIMPSVATPKPLEFGGVENGLVILQNYPQPSEMCIYLVTHSVHVYGLLVQGEVELSRVNWKDLRDGLYDRLMNIHTNQSNRMDYKATLRSISHELAKHGILGITGIDVFDKQGNRYQGRLGTPDGASFGLTDAILPNKFFPSIVLESGSLERVVLKGWAANNVSDLFTLMNSNPNLHQATAPVQENDVLSRMECIHQNYPGDVQELKVIMTERTYDLDEQKAAVLVFRGEGITPPVQHSTTHGSSRSTYGDGATIDVLEWMQDRISGALTDRHAWLLDIASSKHPHVLKNLSLNVSNLTEQGLTSIESVLQRSSLETLHIKCEPLEPELIPSVGQMLCSLQWPTIKSLVLTGENIDGWLQVWNDFGGLKEVSVHGQDPSSLGPRLVALQVLGDKQVKEPISHKGVLSLYDLIFSSDNLSDLQLENLAFQEPHDWEIIAEAIWGSSLDRLSLAGSDQPKGMWEELEKSLVKKPVHLPVHDAASVTQTRTSKSRISRTVTAKSFTSKSVSSKLVVPNPAAPTPTTEPEASKIVVPDSAAPNPGTPNPATPPAAHNPETPNHAASSPATSATLESPSDAPSPPEKPVQKKPPKKEEKRSCDCRCVIQ